MGFSKFIPKVFSRVQVWVLCRLVEFFHTRLIFLLNYLYTQDQKMPLKFTWINLLKTGYPHSFGHVLCKYWHTDDFVSYQRCSVLRSSPGDSRIYRPCRYRAQCSVGDKLSDRIPNQSSPRHSDSFLLYTHREYHSPLHTPLQTQTKAKKI